MVSTPTAAVHGPVLQAAAPAAVAMKRAAPSAAVMDRLISRIAGHLHHPARTGRARVAGEEHPVPSDGLPFADRRIYVRPRRAYRSLAMRLGQSDLRAILRFLSDADAFGAEEAYGPAVRAHLRALIPCDYVGYEEADLEGRRFTDPEAPAHEAEDAIYWALGPCSITEYRVRTGDVSAVRMSDVISRRRYHEQPLYRDYFAPRDVDHILELGLSAVAASYRSLVLYRGSDAPDFSERERAVLEMLRPHLRAREARATLMALVAGRLRALEDRDEIDDLQLTTREREIVAMVAAGRTNAQIAAALWISPATVKKHLENTYVKLGVGSRAAAVSRLQVEVGRTPAAHRRG
jgi:DNA-binding CsgD family transcriptional regulator